MVVLVSSRGGGASTQIGTVPGFSSRESCDSAAKEVFLKWTPLLGPGVKLETGRSVW